MSLLHEQTAAAPAAGAVVRPDAPETDWPLRLAGVLCVVMPALGAHWITVLEATRQAPDLLPGLAGLYGVHLVCLVLFLRRRPPAAWAPAALLVVLLACVQQMMAHRGGIDPTHTWVPGYWLVPLVALAAIAMTRRASIVFSCVAAAAMMLVLAPAQWPPDAQHVADLVWVAQPVAHVAFFCDALRVATDTRRRSLARARAAARARQDQEVQALGRREAGRLLHDHVLHALHALARTEHGPMVVQECRDACEAVRRVRDDDDAVSVEALVAQDPALAQAGARLTGRSTPLPRPIAEAIARAVHESLSNVVRHARAQDCTVQVRQHREAVVVEVHDDGIGFDPDGVHPNRLGVKDSIVKRLDDLGGRATARSAPGRGTTVTLEWPRPTDDDAWFEDPQHPARRSVARTGWPGLVGGAILSLVMAPTFPHGWVVAGVALVCFAMGAEGVRRLLRAPLGNCCLVRLSLAALVGWTTNLLLLPDQPDSLSQLWMGWGGSALVHLVVLSTRLRTGMMIVPAWIAVMVGSLAWRFEDLDTIIMLGPTVAGGSGECIGTLLVLAAAQRVARVEADNSRLASQERARAARVQLASHVDQYWSQRVVTEALPLLERVASGEQPLDAPGLREHARLVEALLRDELVLGVGQRRLLAGLAALRRDGWSVASSLSADDPSQALDCAADLVEGIGASTVAGQQVTLSSRGDSATAVVFDASDEQLALWRRTLVPVGGELWVDPDFVRIVVGRA